MIENSIDARLFQSVYARIDGGEVEDIMYGGARSCAYYASGMLAIFGVMDRAHAIVAKVRRLVEKDLCGKRQMSQCLVV